MNRHGTNALLEIRPADALIDTPVSIIWSDFPAAQQVTLRGQVPNYLGCTWTSHAVFVADAQGCMDVGMQRNPDRTAGVDPMQPSRKRNSALIMDPSWDQVWSAQIYD